MKRIILLHPVPLHGWELGKIPAKTSHTTEDERADHLIAHGLAMEIPSEDFEPEKKRRGRPPKASSPTHEDVGTKSGGPG